MRNNQLQTCVKIIGPPLTYSCYLYFLNGEYQLLPSNRGFRWMLYGRFMLMTSWYLYIIYTYIHMCNYVLPEQYVKDAVVSYSILIWKDNLKHVFMTKFSSKAQSTHWQLRQIRPFSITYMVNVTVTVTTVNSVFCIFLVWLDVFQHGNQG